MQQLGAVCARRQRRQHPQPLLAQRIEPWAQVFRQHCAQLFAQLHRQRRALTRSRDGHLQISALDDRRIIEIAVGRIIDRVAQHSALARCLGHRVIHFLAVSSSDNQKHAIKIVRYKLTPTPFDPALARPIFNLRMRIGRNNGHRCIGAQKALDLGPRNGARADHQAAPAIELHEHGEETHRLHTRPKTAPSAEPKRRNAERNSGRNAAQSLVCPIAVPHCEEPRTT